jgi:hypothetical protein
MTWKRSKPKPLIVREGPQKKIRSDEFGFYCHASESRYFRLDSRSPFTAPPTPSGAVGLWPSTAAPDFPAGVYGSIGVLTGLVAALTPPRRLASPSHHARPWSERPVIFPAPLFMVRMGGRGGFPGRLYPTSFARSLLLLQNGRFIPGGWDNLLSCLRRSAFSRETRQSWATGAMQEPPPVWFDGMR